MNSVNTSTKCPMTIFGAEALRRELHELIKKRPQIVEAISEARKHGDLKENAEYHAAKEEQGLVEARIRDIEYKLAQAQIIDITDYVKSQIAIDMRKVVFGATVQLVNIDTDMSVRYQIVGEDEADIDQGKISYLSPIARALDKSSGDTINVLAPVGKMTYEIEEILYI